MRFELHGIRLIFLVSTAIAFGLVWILLRSREKRGATALIALNASVGFWAFCLFVTTVTGERLTILALRFMYVFVADDGVGLPAEDANRVFEGGYSTGQDGTGLGLTIVDQIATAHDWRVTAEASEGGARFEIDGVSRPL